MAIAFPKNPTINQKFTSGSTSWYWTGYAWKLSASADPTFNTITATTSITVGGGGGVGGSNIFGNLQGNVTGNVTGNISGNAGGNAATATTLQTARLINSVSFDGSSNINVPSLQTGTYTITLDSNGYLNIPNGADTLGAKIASNNNIRIVSNNKTMTLNTTGDLTTPGNVTVTNTMTATAASVTNNITIGGNAVAAAAPTANSHLANKQYVDVKATALSIALS